MENEISKLVSLKLNPAQRAMLVLIKLGLKLSTEISIVKGDSSIKEIVNTLHEVNLYISTRDITINDNNKTLISVAGSQKMADKLEEISTKGSDEEYGLMMGYPKTAVRGFVTNNLLPQEKYPEDMDVNPLCFKLSNEGYKEEMVLVRQWMEMLKLHASNLYNEIYNKTL